MVLLYLKCAWLFALLLLLFMRCVIMDRQLQFFKPVETSADIGYGSLSGLFVVGSIQVGNVSFYTYELAMLPHAPFKSPRSIKMNGRISGLAENDDPTACVQPVHSNLTGSVVYAQRGGCLLLQKIANCQAQGAKAVLFSDEVSDVTSQDITASQDDVIQLAESISIPGMILSKDDFGWLKDHTGEQAAIWTISSQNDTSVWQILLLMLVRPLLMFTAVIFVVLLNINGRKTRKKASPRIVWALPIRLWEPDRQGTWHQSACSICLEDFTNSCEVMTLPCRHEFHVQCVSQWLINRRSVCPLCFQEIQSNEYTPLLP